MFLRISDSDQSHSLFSAITIPYQLRVVSKELPLEKMHPSVIPHDCPMVGYINTTINIGPRGVNDLGPRLDHYHCCRHLGNVVIMLSLKRKDFST